MPDSACAGTAFLTGVKSNLGTVAMHPTVKRGDCVATSDKVKQLESIAKWALDAGKVVGELMLSKEVLFFVAFVFIVVFLQVFEL